MLLVKYTYMIMNFLFLVGKFTKFHTPFRVADSRIQNGENADVKPLL